MARPKGKLVIGVATPADAPALARIHAEVAGDLTARHGKGHWSNAPTLEAVQRKIKSSEHTSRMIVARNGGDVVGVLQLLTRKPWAIDVKYFTPVDCALYLLGMAVALECQGQGIGRRLLKAARLAAQDWPAQAIRLDAYNAPAGAGGFYDTCGYTEVGRVKYGRTPLIYYELLV